MLNHDSFEAYTSFNQPEQVSLLELKDLINESQRLWMQSGLNAWYIDFLERNQQHIADEFVQYYKANDLEQEHFASAEEAWTYSITNIEQAKKAETIVTVELEESHNSKHILVEKVGFRQSADKLEVGFALAQSGIALGYIENTEGGADYTSVSELDTGTFTPDQMSALKRMAQISDIIYTNTTINDQI